VSLRRRRLPSGVCAALQVALPAISTRMTEDEYRAIRQMFTRPGEITGINPEEMTGNFLGPPFPL
jgi:hypothetical protein